MAEMHEWPEADLEKYRRELRAEIERAAKRPPYLAPVQPMDILPTVVKLMALEPSLEERLRLFDQVARLVDEEIDRSWVGGMSNLRDSDKAKQRKQAFNDLGKPPNWDKIVADVIKKNPGKSFRELAEIAGCGKSTIQRHLKRGPPKKL